MTGSVLFWRGVTKASFVLTWASLHGKTEQINLETLAGICANLCSSGLGEIIIGREKVSRTAAFVSGDGARGSKHAARSERRSPDFLQINRAAAIIKLQAILSF